MASSFSAERGEAIWRLFNEIVELDPEARATRLDEACRDDPELRREVASLLAAHQHADTALGAFDQLLGAPRTADEAPREEAQPDPHRLVGQRVSHYQIEAWLGGGGMGVVYRAEDTRLHRPVALKFLPPELTRDPEATARLMQEARAASVLDHTNICTVHDIGETEQGRTFIAMAYYQGETLKAKIARGPLPLPEALDYAVQMAEGLSRAHEAGIVHRDVKPANVIVTERGRVKIVDFGLAKMADVSLTKTGTTMGTVSYMSPEQARGEEVDHRTDIWSLGVVLYEMLAGRRPFQGAYAQAVIYSILNEAPASLQRLRPEVPEALPALVHRALSKARADRPTAEALLGELKTLQRLAGSEAPVTQPRGRWVGAVAVVLVVLTVAGYFLLKDGPDAVTFRLGQTTQVTRAAGLELHPALSPDGRMLAYVAGPVGQMRLFVRQVAGGRPVPLTENFPGDHSWPRWSPDGNRIAFQSRGTIYVVPALGGIPKRLVESSDGACCLAWSPDGRQIAYAHGGTIYVRTVDDGEPRALGEGGHSLAWSPDGSRLAYVAGNSDFVFGVTLSNIEPSSLWVVPVEGGKPVRVTENDHTDMSPVWTPEGRHLLFVSDRDGSRDVHQVALSETGEPLGPPTRLTTGLDAHTIYLSTDGTRLAYAILTIRQNIWAVPIPDDGPISVAEAEPITTGSQAIEGIDVSPDGQWLVFDSNRSGNQDIYKMPIAGGEPEQLTTHPAEDFLPSWSPDGREIAFYSLRNGNRDIFVMSAEGGALQQLTDDPAQEVHPDWSPDGQRIVFYSNKTGPDQLYILSRDIGTQEWGTPVQLTFDEEEGKRARWSPDGDLIAYLSNNSLRVISPEGGMPRVLIQDQGSAPLPRPGFPAWSSDGQTVYYKAYDTDRRSSIWSVSVLGGSPRLLARFDDPTRPSRREFTTDGERFFFTITEHESDLWMMEIFAEE